MDMVKVESSPVDILKCWPFIQNILVPRYLQELLKFSFIFIYFYEMRLQSSRSRYVSV
jgi:hypothetical protein